MGAETLPFGGVVVAPVQANADRADAPKNAPMATAVKIRDFFI